MKLMPEIEKITKTYLESDGFKKLCDAVKVFCDTNKEQFKSCYVHIDRGVITFYLVSNQKQYDFSVAEKITDFGLELTVQFPDEHIDLRQMPEWGGWYESEQYIHVWGERLDK